MPFDPTTLFAHRAPNPVPYATRDAAFAAVRARAKAVVQQPVAKGRDLAAFVAGAFAHELAVVVVEDRGEPEAYAIARDLGEAWRIPAIRTLRDTAHGWSDDAERQLSALLGYAPAQRAAWLALHREHAAAWGAATVFALLDRARRTAIDALGRRCLGTGALAVFRHRSLPLAAAAHRRVPRDLALARFALPHDAIALRGRALQTATIGARALPAINAQLASRIEILTARGWR